MEQERKSMTVIRMKTVITMETQTNPSQQRFPMKKPEEKKDVPQCFLKMKPREEKQVLLPRFPFKEEKEGSPSASASPSINKGKGIGGQTPTSSSSLVLCGCKRCHLYAMTDEKNPRCPKCHSSFLVKFSK